MNIVVIGLGSMGKRRIRLIRQLDPNANIMGIDSDPTRQAEAKEKFGITVCDDFDAIPEETECAFVCTAPLAHAEIIRRCLRKNMHVFSELNLVNDLYDENIALAKEKNVVLFMSSTHLYREEIRYIINAVKKSNGKLNYRYHVGQYLPDWHPWENYKDYFIGDKKTNGCREILAIELPWILSAFGSISDLSVLADKLTDLDINYPDSYLLQVSHSTGIKGAIAFDVVCRKPIRSLEIYGEYLNLSWDGTPDGLRQYNCQKGIDENIRLYSAIDHQDGYCSYIVENNYKNEIMAFFDYIKKDIVPPYCFEDDKETLHLIDRIELEGSWR